MATASFRIVTANLTKTRITHADVDELQQPFKVILSGKAEVRHDDCRGLATLLQTIQDALNPSGVLGEPMVSDIISSTPEFEAGVYQRLSALEKVVLTLLKEYLTCPICLEEIILSNAVSQEICNMGRVYTCGHAMHLMCVARLPVLYWRTPCGLHGPTMTNEQFSASEGNNCDHCFARSWAMKQCPTCRSEIYNRLF